MSVDADTVRQGNSQPLQDTRGITNTASFGSAHPGSFNAVMADRSIRRVRYSVALDVLHRQSIALEGPAWAGQPVRLLIGREPDAAREGDAQRVFRARLVLELPRLGRVEVDLRLAGDAIAADIAAAGRAQAHLHAALPEFAAALQARGLRPVALAAQAAP